MLTLAHLSDVHIGPLGRLPLAHLNLKRGLGYINWHRSRRNVHRLEVADMLMADMASQKPDHIAVTGDLVNIGLPNEYVTALGWLQRVGPPERVSVVPGNHDIYTRLGADPGVGRWQAYMTGDAWGIGLTAGWIGFPYVRKVGALALIGLNSAVPTRPFVAGGRLGDEQLGRLPSLLKRCGEEGLIRVIMIHHPPFPGQASQLRGLADAAALQGVVAEHGAELILHGHNHRNMEGRTAFGQATAVSLGVPSFSAATTHHDEPLGRYNLIRFHRPSETGCRIELVGRGLRAAGGEVIEIERRWIHPATADNATQTKI